jgi:serine/threonine protein kinase
MVEELKNIDQIFWDALQIEDAAEREAFVARVCGDDEHLRQMVQKLINAQPRAERFLERPFRLDATTEMPAIAERPGTVIGPYKLLQKIGEGGFGVVFLAEQESPIKRRVALKVIKPGMDTRQVIARFEAERQALAMMDHPNIAKVLDAGTTDTGRPYFVMELVKGVPITTFCDEKQLSLRERLELFLCVCQAVQHAHQKGVIHRDIKPTNVLVAEYDHDAVPKVIDFGVAKATAHKLTERTMFTEFGQLVGTFEYMSPEQAKLNQLDIDTRSDIYSLGVLLYELLTGATPFERKRLQEAAFDEMLRIIREEEPPKPSTRLSTAVELPAIAARRGAEGRKLTGLIKGELDWVVMKALDKERNRRYETANGLAKDIERYLNDELVQARPASASYRFKKLLRRNKGPVAAAVLVFTALVCGIIGTTAGLIEARRQRDVAAAAVESERIAKESSQVLNLINLAINYNELGKHAEAIAHFKEALALSKSKLGPDHPNSIVALTNLGTLFAYLGNWEEAASAFGEAYHLRPTNHGMILTAASTALKAGQAEQYRRICQVALQEFSGTENPLAADRLAKAGLLAPQSTEDLEQFTALAEVAIDRGKEHIWINYFYLVRGMAAYRSGDWPATLDWCGRSRQRAGGFSPLVTLNLFFEAMAHHKMHQIHEARSAMNRATTAIEDHFNTFPLGRGSDWNDWLLCDIVHREAEALLTEDR